jgi:HEAT repeats
VITPDAFVQELAEVGVSVESPWDLVNSRRSYRAAIPLLVEWLDRVDTEVPAHERPRFREGLVRSLAVKDGRGVAGPALLREFRRDEASWDYRWAVGNSLEVVADDSVLDGVVELAQERSYGRDREMVVLALARMKDPRAVDVLTELLDDDSVVGHAVIALGRLKAVRARPAIEHCLTHPQPWVRRKAKKALERLAPDMS